MNHFENADAFGSFKMHRFICTCTRTLVDWDSVESFTKKLGFTREKKHHLVALLEVRGHLRAQVALMLGLEG